MMRAQYKGMDVHQATTVVAVRDADGRLVMQTIVAIVAAAIQRPTGSCFS